jgi:hypothetical protein
VDSIGPSQIRIRSRMRLPGAIPQLRHDPSAQACRLFQTRRPSRITDQQANRRYRRPVPLGWNWGKAQDGRPISATGLEAQRQAPSAPDAILKAGLERLAHHSKPSG